MQISLSKSHKKLFCELNIKINPLNKSIIKTLLEDYSS